jgi:hypothetical protein
VNNSLTLCEITRKQLQNEWPVLKEYMKFENILYKDKVRIWRVRWNMMVSKRVTKIGSNDETVDGT